MGLFNSEEKPKEKIIHTNESGTLCPFCGSNKAEFLGMGRGSYGSRYYNYFCDKCNNEFESIAVPLNFIKVKVIK